VQQIAESQIGEGGGDVVEFTWARLR